MLSMGTSTISMVIFHSYVTLLEGSCIIVYNNVLEDQLAMGIEMAIESSLMNRHEKWVKFPNRCVQVYQRVTLRSSTNEMDGSIFLYIYILYIYIYAYFFSHLIIG